MCSRLCHDLIGPVGAFNNGLELWDMEEEQEMRDSAIDLLRHSAEAANNKLKFLRLAFGASGGDGNLVDLSTIRAAVDGHFADSRFDINWLGSDDQATDIAKPVIRLLLNMILCGSTGLFRGGEMQIFLTPMTIRLVCQGPKATLGEDVVNGLTGKTVAEKHEDARIIEAFVAQAIAREIGAIITVDRGVDGFAISVNVS